MGKTSRDQGTRFELWIPIIPRAMKRPRVFRSGHTISPTKTTVDDIAVYLGGNHFRSYAELVGNAPIFVYARFFLRKAPHTKYKRPTAQRHGDLDNHAKTLLDAINVFITDAQVCRLDVSKEWPEDGTGPGIWLEVEIMEGIAE